MCRRETRLATPALGSRRRSRRTCRRDAPVPERPFVGRIRFRLGMGRCLSPRGPGLLPELVSAIPYTPATGGRLLAAPGMDASIVRERLINALLDLAKDLGVSSCHVLFPGEDGWGRLRSTISSSAKTVSSTGAGSRARISRSFWTASARRSARTCVAKDGASPSSVSNSTHCRAGN